MTFMKLCFLHHKATNILLNRAALHLQSLQHVYTIFCAMHMHMHRAHACVVLTLN